MCKLNLGNNINVIQDVYEHFLRELFHHHGVEFVCAKIERTATRLPVAF
jgi:hypothetical protein